MNGFFQFTETNASECKISELSKKIEKANPNISELDKPIAQKIDTSKFNNMLSEAYKNDVDESSGLQSTYAERYQQTPVSNGYWNGKRGESTFYSENAEANKHLEKVGANGVEYNNCIPNFSEVSKGDAKIEEMSTDRGSNFRQADTKLAEQKGCTPREVADWREKNEYTWHECNDMQTCQKIPRVVNSTFGHLGGVSECKKAMKESEFDD